MCYTHKKDYRHLDKRIKITKSTFLIFNRDSFESVFESNDLLILLLNLY